MKIITLEDSAWQHCSECGESHDRLIELYATDDMNVAQVCENCLKQALAMLDSQ